MLNQLRELQNTIKLLQAEEKKLKADIIAEYGPGTILDGGFTAKISHINDTTRTDYKRLALSFKPSQYKLKKYSSPVNGYYRISAIKTA